MTFACLVVSKNRCVFSYWKLSLGDYLEILNQKVYNAVKINMSWVEEAEMKKLFFILLVIFLNTGFLSAQQSAPDDGSQVADEVTLLKQSRGNMIQSRAVVERLEKMSAAQIKSEEKDGAYDGVNIFVKLLDGPFKGREVKIENYLYKENPFVVSWKPGMRVLVGYLIQNGKISLPAIYSADRTWVIVLLILVFVIGVLILGRKQGVLSLAALFVTIVLVFVFFIPAVLNGWPPLLTAIGVSVLSSALTFLIISGWTHKTLSATLGVLLGFGISALLLILFGNWMNITGVMNTNMVFLRYTTNLSIGQILFAGILIGAVGAVMDVAISMASIVEEIHTANPSYSSWKLFTSALNVGKDLLGTMTNTLIMAYVGAALPFIILVYLQYGHNTALLNILNLEVISEEILRSIIGSLGMIVTIPATALMAAYLRKRATKRGVGG